MFAVALESEAVVADSSTWQSLALTGTATYTVAFDGAPARLIGEPSEYLSRDGFWHGGAGVKGEDERPVHKDTCNPSRGCFEE